LNKLTEQESDSSLYTKHIELEQSNLPRILYYEKKQKSLGLQISTLGHKVQLEALEHP